MSLVHVVPHLDHCLLRLRSSDRTVGTGRQKPRHLSNKLCYEEKNAQSAVLWEITRVDEQSHIPVEKQGGTHFI